MSLGSSAKNGQSDGNLACPKPHWVAAGQPVGARWWAACFEMQREDSSALPRWVMRLSAGWIVLMSLCDYIGRKTRCAFCCWDEGFANTGVLCQHLLQPSRLVRLVYSTASTALWSTHIPWQELKEHFQQPPITVLITRDYQVPQNKPQASFCMQTSKDFLVHAGRALFRISSACLYITHHCQLPLNSDTLKHCCACRAHAFQKACHVEGTANLEVLKGYFNVNLDG